ncbi:hypothetical protein G6012_10360, partial [Dietzia schimae]|nr:hypothetical protein [Dietzia kunjamensis subsp. schimae]
ADLLLVRAGGLDDVIADAPPDRIVLHAGCVVAAREVLVVVDPGAPPSRAPSPRAQSPATHRPTPTYEETR